jgi:hypothetical protein
VCLFGVLNAQSQNIILRANGGALCGLGQLDVEIDGRISDYLRGANSVKPLTKVQIDRDEHLKAAADS